MVGPEPCNLPLDERDLPFDVEPVELLPAAAPDSDELTGDATAPGLRDAAERGALEARAVRELDECLLQAPPVDGHRLLTTSLRPGRASPSR